MSKIIVFGASGQLGLCLQQISAEKNIDDIIFLAEQEANILDTALLENVFEKYKPEYCINCAAYTAVDKAEDDSDAARKVNKEGAGNMAALCAAYSCTLIHISTDFVFRGDGNILLSETDNADPINIYGLTKLEGEQLIQGSTAKYYILRTSWLYSEYGNNFVKTMLKLGKERDELKIIADQIGTPTYAIDLARCIFHIITNDQQQYGLYHYSNEGLTSWYDFAKAIFDIGEVTVRALPVRTSEYVTRAVRPTFSVMDKSKIKQTFNIEIPYWRESLEECMARLRVEAL